MSKNIIFSGVQPTGNLHLGNYLGAIRNWVKLQEEYDCIFCIVDLHAITIPQDPVQLRNHVYETAAAYIACGIKPENVVIFSQSAVSGHSELAWILGCHTPLGWLNRMTQFKEKAGKHRENAVLGLYGYPVLMAADILLYKTTHVPVGDDQKQHLELARDIAGAFNRQYGVEFFVVPEPLILGGATRVMSLRDGRKKMSKSDESDNSRINLTDDSDVIFRKFKKAKSDSIMGVSYDINERPEAANLLTIYASLAGISIEEAVDRFASKGFGDFKKELGDVAVAALSPITQRMNELKDDRVYLDNILKNGADKAGEIAEKTMKEVREIIGFLSC